MGLNLLPKEEKFFDLLEKSAANIQVMASECLSLAKTWKVDDERVKKIRELEHEGDMITHEIADKLNRAFITPIDREDIHALASELDDVADLMHALVSRMQLFHVVKIEDDLIQLLDVLEQSVSTVVKAVNGLRNMEASRRVLDYCIEINRLENGGDRILERALSKLFADGRDPIDVIKWKELFEIAETATDKCEDVANTLESIIVKHG